MKGKANGGKTPAPAEESPFNLSRRNALVIETEIESSTRSDLAWLKDMCLRRDKFSCILTGFLDHVSIANKRTIDHEGRLTLSTDVAHILPSALAGFDEKDAAQTHNKAMIWQSLFRYFPRLDGKIAPGSINSPSNAMTMHEFWHREFGSFRLFFEPTVSEAFNTTDAPLSQTRLTWFYRRTRANTG